MLHEPEFESSEPENDSAAAEPKQSSRVGRIVRGFFYTGIALALATAVGIQASPDFAARVGKSVPEPVAAAVASITGEELPVNDGGKCCSSMSRASLMASTEQGGCCSSSSSCPMEQAAMAAAAESGCCSSQSNAVLASTDEGCSGVCPLSGASEETLAAADETAEEAVSLPAPEEPIAAELVESADDSI